jgi:putative DNA primase/helicase
MAPINRLGEDSIMADLGIHIEAVARKLLGEPNPHLSTKSQLRFGTHGSLAVDIAGEKRGTWYDHETSEGGGVLDLVRAKKGLSNGETYDWLRSIGIEVEAKPESRTTRRIVATYDYTDEFGQLLFQVVRYHPKDFRQRRPDGKGGWIWSVKGTRMVPFNLPALMDAETVYVVEGEKDALNLGRLGVVATTNPGGASKPGNRQVAG